MVADAAPEFSLVGFGLGQEVEGASIHSVGGILSGLQVALGAFTAPRHSSFETNVAISIPIYFTPTNCLA